MSPELLFKLLEGQVIEGKYHLQKLLGVGGFGAVFRADEVVRGRVLRQVAVKVIPSTGSATEQNRQLDELLTAVNLDHPHIIRCFVAGEFTHLNATWLYLVMELADYSLQTQLEHQPLGSTAIKDVMAQLAQALDYLHAQNLVHQDLKPANVLWARNAWKISDFGTVRNLNTQSYLQTANPIGSISFMPPEAFDGLVSQAWDIWSLGILSVVATTGVLPYQCTDPIVLLKRVINADLQLDSLSSELRLLIQPCLQRERRNRCTAKQLIQAVTNPPHAPVTEHSRTDDSVKQEKPVIPSPLVTANPQPHYRIQTYQETLPGNMVLEMVVIPAGTFLMGSPHGEGDDRERPQHYVNIPTFYMGKYTVTNAQWETVMERARASSYGRKFEGDNQPIVEVSWDDAQAFCQKLSQMSGKLYRLPSEAEWEYGCRAGTKTPFHFGEMITTELVNYKGDSSYNGSPKGEYREKTTDVGSFPANDWGLHDMHGNVWEWCEDDWHSNYIDAPNDGSAWTDANQTDAHKVLRGGPWYVGPESCRSAVRRGPPKHYSYNVIGFRVCCTPWPFYSNREILVARS